MFRPSRPFASAAVLGIVSLGIVAWKGDDVVEKLGLAESAQAAQPAEAQPARIGLNVAIPAVWIGESNFANLAGLGNWWYTPPGVGKWADAWPDRMRDVHGPQAQAAGEALITRFNRPADAAAGDRVRCTAQTTLRPEASDAVRLVSDEPGSFTLAWEGPWSSKPATLVFRATRPGDAVRDLDCRPEGVAPDAAFLPIYLESMRPFAAIRFMDWQRANANLPVTWASRAEPLPAWQGGPQGVAIEHMIDLANTLKADPWFCIAYQADADYIERFARLVRDRLDPSLTVYVELGNEIWNGQFRASQQAAAEGLAAGLSHDPNQARLYRYAQKASTALDIWAKVYADAPDHLVRVVSTQAGWPWTAEQVLGHGDTAKHVDALAVAPYFDMKTRLEPPFDEATDFAEVDRAVDKAIENAVANKAIAQRYGKRLIGYEGGQHLPSTRPAEVIARMTNSPRMYAAYQRYLRQWNDKAGDLLMLYASTSPAGGFGLQDYIGQPLNQAPRRRATIEAIEGLSRQKARLAAPAR